MISAKNLAFLLLSIFLIYMGSDHAVAQSLSMDLGNTEGGSATAKMVQMMTIITILSLAPSILIMVTSFTRIVIVMSFLRTAMGLQQSPPNMVMISLSLFLTGFVMSPVLEKSYYDGIQPYTQEKISEEQAFENTVKPLHKFMRAHAREKDLALFMNFAKIDTLKDPADLPLRVLVPAFMISELHRAFEIGFLIFIPFLVIDLAVASVLMAMGMMMLPPTTISLPFKLIFFVLIDGWALLVGSLVKGFHVT